jgi:hypothetical protein
MIIRPAYIESANLGKANALLQTHPTLALHVAKQTTNEADTSSHSIGYTYGADFAMYLYIHDD